MRKPVKKMKIELVERKGLGHPDHIIDAVCEEISKSLSRYYLKKYGMILHHNVDKGLIVGGESEPKFGGGVLTKPIEMYIAGRAYYEEEDEVHDIAKEAVKKYISENFMHLDPIKHMNIYILLRRGASELASLIKAGKIPLSNDTSFGVGYYPYSPLEKIVLEIEKFLNSRRIKEEFPYIGEDIKIAGLRINKKVNLTLAIAIVDRYVNGIREYVRIKKEILNLVEDFIRNDEEFDEYKSKIFMNTADNLKTKNIYLTVTGTSAEMGDDANTGRGNRVNGLITPNRFMSLEAVAGKNPINHVGKIYNVLAFEISKKIYLELSDYIEEVYVRILSRIGYEITNPQIVNVMYVPKKNIKKKVLNYEIQRIIEDNFTIDRFRNLTKEILEGKYLLF
ncbi:TPA: methionine adenosyltransferase [Candidatus Geothermarchaeota archaeon]|nr:methionine adenosyltransferase [Candidatus Geothermarchaeota archaeon]